MGGHAVDDEWRRRPRVGQRSIADRPTKGADDSDDFADWPAVYAPVATWPIMVSKSDAKIIAKGLDTTLSRVSEEFCAEEQKGLRPRPGGA